MNKKREDFVLQFVMNRALTADKISGEGTVKAAYEAWVTFVMMEEQYKNGGEDV